MNRNCDPLHLLTVLYSSGFEAIETHFYLQRASLWPLIESSPSKELHEWICFKHEVAGGGWPEVDTEMEMGLTSRWIRKLLVENRDFPAFVFDTILLLDR